MTTEELIIKKYNVESFNEVALYGDSLKKIMTEFAKYHVEQCQKSARIIDDPNSYTGNTGIEYPPDQIIEFNYPLDLIK